MASEFFAPRWRAQRATSDGIDAESIPVSPDAVPVEVAGEVGEASVFVSAEPSGQPDLGVSGGSGATIDPVGETFAIDQGTDVDEGIDALLIDPAGQSVDEIEVTTVAAALDGDVAVVEETSVTAVESDDGAYGAVAEPDPAGGAGAAPVVPPVVDDPDDDGVDDGGRRRHRALVIVAVALLTGALGMLIGSRIQSPADRAASRAAPEPSLITVPVERRTLSSELILNGEVAYDEPVTVQLSGPVGIDADEKALLTRVPAVGDDVAEGKAVLEVTNRPVIALQGALPMYRTITLGTTGPDVAQLETALKRLGFDPGTVDQVADAATMAAVTQMYSDAGFPAPAATATEQSALSAAKQTVADAQSSLNAAKSDLDQASSPMSESERMELDRAVTDADNAVPQAKSNVGNITREHDGLVAAAKADRDAANNAVTELQNLYNAARAGGVNPETGQRYSAGEIGDLARQLAEATSTASAASAAVGSAQSARDAAIAEANAAVGAAEYQLKLAKVRQAEAGKSADTGTAKGSVSSAETALADAQAELAKAQAAAGVRVPAGEVIFVPVLPAKLTEWYQPAGAEATGQMGSIASALTRVTARISRTDTAQVPVGAKVSIEVRDAGLTTTGVVKSVGEPTATQSSNDEFGGPSNASDGRLEVVVEPDDPAAISEYVRYSAKVIVEVESTDAEQLVVPVAALSVGPDGDDRVEVEREPATDDKAAKTEIVPVTIGLTANGLAVVTPKSGSLEAGDRVVIGFDYPDRRVATGDASSDGTAPSGSAPDSGDSTSEGDSGDGASEGASPLEEYFGYNGDPVAEREKMLAMEESVAKCMKAEGFEYIPVDYAASTETAEYMSPDFGKKYGYGVIYNYETYESEEATPDTNADPNQEYVMGLSESEMQDYYKALNGMDLMVEMGDEETATMPPLEEQGCYGKAQVEVGGESPMANEEVWTRVDELMTQTMEDPEYKKLVAAWQDCMSQPFEAAGITETPDSPDSFDGGGVNAAVERLVAEARGGKVEEFSSEEELMALGEDVNMANYTDGNSGYAIVGELKPLSADDLERLRAMELELWNADEACQDKVGLSDYQTQQETKLVDQLKSEFPEPSK